MMTLSGQPRDLMKGLKQKSQMVTEGHTEITLHTTANGSKGEHEAQNICIQYLKNVH